MYIYILSVCIVQCFEPLDRCLINSLIIIIIIIIKWDSLFLFWSAFFRIFVLPYATLTYFELDSGLDGSAF